MFRGLKKYIVHDRIVHATVMSRIALLRDFDVIVNSINPDRMKRFDGRTKSLSCRGEADIFSDMLLKNI